MNQITKLATTSLHIHPENIKFFDDIEGEQYERFKKSIQEDGVLTPLMIAPDMTIISGHQRYKACKDLGINLLPVIIREDLVDEDEKLKKLLATNFGREKNDPVKQGRVYEKYEKLCGIYHGNHIKNEKRKNCVSQEQIAKELGVSVRTLQNLKKLNTLAPELQELVSDGTVKYTTALNVWAKLPNDEQVELIKEVGKETLANMKAKDTQQYIDKIRNLEKELENEKNKKPIIKEVEKVVDNTDYETIEKLKNEKRQAELELLKLKDKLTNPKVIYKNDPELEKEVNRLKRIIDDKEKELNDYHKVRMELAEKSKMVSQFTGENTNLELMSTTSVVKAQIMDFLKEMSKYDYLAESFNEIPLASRNEWMKSIRGIYKWSKNILDTVDLQSFESYNPNNQETIVQEAEFMEVIE